MKMRRCFTDPHYWKNPALKRSREKNMFPCVAAWGAPGLKDGCHRYKGCGDTHAHTTAAWEKAAGPINVTAKIAAAILVTTEMSFTLP